MVFDTEKVTTIADLNNWWCLQKNHLKKLSEEVQKTIKEHAGVVECGNIPERKVRRQKVNTAVFYQDTLFVSPKLRRTASHEHRNTKARNGVCARIVRVSLLEWNECG